MWFCNRWSARRFFIKNIKLKKHTLSKDIMFSNPYFIYDKDLKKTFIKIKH